MAVTGKVKLFVCLGIMLFELGHCNVACRNDKGKEVDWYILYKLPQFTGDGLKYLYMDESTNGWRESEERINSASGSVAKTLKPLFDYYKKKTEGFGYILYNDQPPKTPAPSSFGHAKGVVMLDRISGVWLSHTTPRFPSYQSEDFWPRSCYPKNEPWFKVMELTSRKGHRFKSFAKYSRFQDDLYAGLIVKFTKQDLFVKSWGKLRQPLPSVCSNTIPHHVYNINEVNPHRRGPFDVTVDHSKWCVTRTGDFTCVADMNREVSQMNRGGGAVCTNDPTVGAAFRAAVKSFEPCDVINVERKKRNREL
ncbi:unnamed protein product [Knipowitschia caucasica]